jgi:4-amino-4-deoxy-L-arabinose transferase-like glycosyltransferase
LREAGACVARICRGERKHYSLLFLIVLASVTLSHRLATGSLPPFDDTTYALVSKTILKTGDWVTMRWLDIPYFVFGKPPLNFWITASFYRIFGISECTSRLSGVVHAVLCIVAVYFLARAIHSHIAGLIAAMFLLSLPEYHRISQSAMLDVPVTFYITLALLFYLLADRTRRLLYYCLFGVSFGLAIMVKSVLGLLPLLVIGLFHLLARDLRPLFTLRFAAGLGSGLLVCIPWHVLQFLRFGWVFIDKYFFSSVSYNVSEVLLGAQRSSLSFYIHNFYANEPVHVTIFLASLPLLVLALIRRDRASVFLLAHILTVIIPFSAFQTRMPWYMTPLFPAMAVSSAILLVRLLQVRQLEPAISLALIGFFVFQMQALWSTDHWYLRGEPELKQIILDFKSKSSDRDVLFGYGFGEPINTGPFYGDRKVIFVTDSQEQFKVQQRIGDYLNAGLILFVANEELAGWIQSSPGRYVLLRAATYRALEAKLKHPGVTVVSSNEVYVLIKS